MKYKNDKSWNSNLKSSNHTIWRHLCQDRWFEKEKCDWVTEKIEYTHVSRRYSSWSRIFLCSNSNSVEIWDHILIFYSLLNLFSRKKKKLHDITILLDNKIFKSHHLYYFVCTYKSAYVFGFIFLIKSFFFINIFLLLRISLKLIIEYITLIGQ